MIKKTLLLFLLIVFIFSCDNNQNQLKIDLETVKGNGPFRYSLKPLHPEDSQPEIKGVPPNFKNYVIRSMDLLPYQQAWNEYKAGNIDKIELEQVLNRFNQDSSNLTTKTIDHNLLFIIGTSQNGRIAISYDSDNDENFKGEKILYFPSSVKSKEKQRYILDTLSHQRATFEYFNGNKIVDKTFSFKPIPFFASNWQVSYTDSIENNYRLAITQYAHKKGFFSPGEKEYKIALQLSPYPFLLDNFTKFIVAEKNDTFPDYENHPFHNQGDTFNLDNTAITLSSYDYWGKSATIKIIRPNKDSTGITKGDYIPNISSTTLNGKEFDLNEYQGNYVLLDFWGTWCSPCVKSIPELIELQSQFADKKLVIVSVAVDSDKEKVSRFIKKHNMNSIQLFEKRGSSDLTKRLKITTYPTLILLDKNGKIIARNEDLEAIRNIIENKIN